MPQEPRFRVLQNVGAPPQTSGRKRRWGHLPLDDIDVGDMIELPMSEEQSSQTISALSSYVWRLSKKSKKKFSVKKNNIGIGIWRVS